MHALNLHTHQRLRRRKPFSFASMFTTRIMELIKPSCMHELVEAGFEYVCDVSEAKIFRKRK